MKNTIHSKETTSTLINPSSSTIELIIGQGDHRFTSLPHFINTKETLNPLDGYETYPLEESIKYLIDLFTNNVHRYVSIAIQNSYQPKDELIHDHYAAIHQSSTRVGSNLGSGRVGSGRATEKVFGLGSDRVGFKYIRIGSGRVTKN